MIEVDYEGIKYRVAESRENGNIEIMDLSGKVLGGYYERGVCEGGFLKMGKDNPLDFLGVHGVLEARKEKILSKVE